MRRPGQHRIFRSDPTALLFLAQHPRRELLVNRRVAEHDRVPLADEDRALRIPGLIKDHFDRPQLVGSPAIAPHVLLLSRAAPPQDSTMFAVTLERRYTLVRFSNSTLCANAI